jgi:hypothetical protein
MSKIFIMFSGMKFLLHNDSALSVIHITQNNEHWYGAEVLLIFHFKIYAIQPWYCCAVFEVLTAIVMKCSVFWDITPCSPLKVNWRFGEACHLHIQDRSRGIYWHAGFLLSLFFTPKMEEICSPKRRLTCNGPHGVISQMTEFFILLFLSLIITVDF